MINADAASIDVSRLGALEWRCIGPHRGGRVVAVAGDPADPMTFYFGGCNGGVWKTTDGGTYWQNVSDGFFRTASVGALAVADADPNVIYAGMGECCIRVDVSHGDGVYKSIDGGKTWTHRGLEDTRFISRIRVHPRDPDLVYVAALGHAFGPNETRGVFRSRDGGQTWERVLYRSPSAGACDLSMDPTNPRVLYAALWEGRRTPWSIVSGGQDTGLFKSTDGGDTWTDLTNNPGLPQGLKGRIGVALSPARPDRVWALVEAADGALHRSDDGGATWERVCADPALRRRPWYFSHIFADPQHPETVYVLSQSAFKSTDGGRSFTQITTPHIDNHDLWIDPRNPRRMIEGNDGGACVSFNGGASWSTIYNQPTAPFYRVATDIRFPYRVYGTQQDSSAISVPSRSFNGVILLSDCHRCGTSESGDIAVRPDDPNIVYSGAIGSAPGGGGVLLRYDHRTGQVRIVTVWPEIFTGWGAKDLKYRFQWTFPIHISPHDPNILYVAAERVFRSTSEGTSWEAISPDLTRNDITKQEASGGPITKDTAGADHYCTVFAFAESRHEPGVLWAGSDDGLVHISRDGGGHWENITPPNLPEWTTIGKIEPSPHDPACAYIAAWRYKLDDYRPYLYRTRDYGRTWTQITDGIPDGEFTRVIREDPVRRGLLYAGTETGLYVSFDDGEHWQRFQLNLPAVPVYDLQVKQDDLVAATHGRSFWILDDLTPLRQLTDEALRMPAYLCQPRPAIRLLPEATFHFPTGPGKNYLWPFPEGVPATFYETRRPNGDPDVVLLDAGRNPPDGVIVWYYLGKQPEGEVTLTFLDARGEVIKTFSSAVQPGHGPGVHGEAGLNRFVWDMRYPDARPVEGQLTAEGTITAPLAPPGTYQVRLTVDGVNQTQSLEIHKDPRVTVTQTELDEQFALLLAIRDQLSQTHDAIGRIRDIRRQVERWERSGRDGVGPVAEAAAALKTKLTAIETELIQVHATGPWDVNLPSRLNVKLAALASVVSSADAAPTRQSYDVFHDVSSRIDDQLARLGQTIAIDVTAFNDLVKQSGIPAVSM
jgi:photosystem II stability/assembly factor-like uncharacterized protein